MGERHPCQQGLSRRQQKVRGLPTGAQTGAGTWGRPGWGFGLTAAATLAAWPSSAQRPLPAGRSDKPTLTTHLPAAALNARSVHSPSTSMATSSQCRQLLSDHGPPSREHSGYTQGTGNSQVPQSQRAELLAIVEESGKEIRPTSARSKSTMERLKGGIIHA